MLYTGKAYHDYVNATKDNSQEVISPEDIAAFSDADARCIAVRLIKDQFSYWCALHEVGHILTFDHRSQEVYAFAIKKVTKYILASEYKASVRAMELNKYIHPKHIEKWAVENQAAFLRAAPR